uniref:EOG090X0H1B n=1 Tax=Scapholeberis mucronata TaxID=202097 RepID=A0A4Y7NL32_9CRUS|nr:EOG090X0H1B [Scapholeberis mucronata]SVE93969.1 EOG090X0H1B [Scapholeberis mucronata]
MAHKGFLLPTVQITSNKNAKTLSPAHLKQCIEAESRFDFLKDLVCSIPDVQTEGDEGGVVSVPSTPTIHQQQPSMFRSLSEASSSTSGGRSKVTGTGRPRGRPRKNLATQVSVAPNKQRAWADRKSDSEDTDSGDSDEEEEDENNSTDTDSLPKQSSLSKNGKDLATATANPASLQFNAVQPNFYQEIGGQNSSSFQIQINLPPQTAPSDDGEAHRVILRPKSVQERIKDLNMQARQFANAVTAIQTGGSSRANGVSGRSLQVTPWGSPRLLSPVDVRHIVPQYSEGCKDQQRFSPGTSPSRWPWSRTGSWKSSKVNFDVTQDDKLKGCEQLWLEEKDKIIQQLPVLLESSQSVNQEHFRESGLISVLPKLILSSNRLVKQKACILTANTAINEKNNHDMRSVTAGLTRVVQATSLNDPGLLSSALTALINISVLPTWHEEMKPILHEVYSLLDEGHWNSDGVSFQSLRLLINLSCNEAMVPSLLAAQVIKKLRFKMSLKDIYCSNKTDLYA